MSYYNTTNQPVAVKEEEEAKCQKQEHEVLNIFYLNQGQSYTPFEILRALQNKSPFFLGVPITSIRRAITNLEKKKFIQKTGEQRIGDYGKKNYCWKFSQGVLPL